jgi:hypothetical protein
MQKQITKKFFNEKEMDDFVNKFSKNHKIIKKQINITYFENSKSFCYIVIIDYE